MALKQAIRANKIKNYRKELEPLLARKEEIETTIRSAIEELESREFSDEELVDAEAVQTELEEEEKTLQERIDELEAKIAGLEEENRSEESEVENAVERSETKPIEERKEVFHMTKREARIAYLNQESVREFYGKIRETVETPTPAFVGADLTIPVEVIDNLLPAVAERSVFYNEVTVVRLNGQGRAIVEGANPEAIWTEMCDPVEELALLMTAVELDGYKVGGYIPVCNAIIEDSMINLANYVEDKLATAIAKALDKAVIAGEGSTAKQPLGIIEGVTPTALADAALPTFLATYGAVRADNLGTVKIAMRRADYFTSLFPALSAANNGVYMPNLNELTIGGLPIIFSDYVPEGTFIIGDFKKYLLGERSGNTFAVSRDVKFIEDQTVFKMTARYDGKPIDADYFGHYSFFVETQETPEA